MTTPTPDSSGSTTPAPGPPVADRPVFDPPVFDPPAFDPPAFDPSVFSARRSVVAVQGLGFVGAAMATAVASARDGSGDRLYNVVGVDLDDAAGSARIGNVRNGRFPFETADESLVEALAEATRAGNLTATSDPTAYAAAQVVVVDVPLDIDWRSEKPALVLAPFEAALRTVGGQIGAGTLVLIETTVPPGSTEKVALPVLDEVLRGRGMSVDDIHVAHSYERVMPGADYFDSIVNYWRVYAGTDDEAARLAHEFLSSVINTADFPLTRLSSTTASETAKVLENTYRATTIALMEEWGRFAEAVGVDLFEIVDAIRMRPTHSNMRTPGFGVGGYCLTKDPLFAAVAARELFGLDAEFPMSTAAVRTNDAAPIEGLNRIERLVGSLDGRRVLLAGISYRQDVGDTRYSPSETFARAAQARGATIVPHDPLVDHWDELGVDVPDGLPSPREVDVVVFAVPHAVYREIDMATWLDGATPLVFDGFDVLTATQRSAAIDAGCVVASLGKPTEGLR